MNTRPVIGIIGGMGPHAGLDLMMKLTDHTKARADSEHLPVALLSFPDRIGDRSAFLLDSATPNPAHALIRIVQQLEALNAAVIGIPCNTAHAPAIYNELCDYISSSEHPMQVIHMIEETVRFIRRHHPEIERVGVLSTLAVYRLGLYRMVLVREGIEPIVPDAEIQETVINPVIFDPSYGLKAQSNPPTARARQDLQRGIDHLAMRGAQAVILGCTELPLVNIEVETATIPLIDPAVALARKLISTIAPEQLKPLTELHAASEER